MSPGAIAHFAGRIAASNFMELKLPYRLTYAVTDRCQARCAMCNIWQKPRQQELSLAEIDRLFRMAHNFSWINLSGGELFQRNDIREILLSIIGQSRRLYLLNFPTNGIQTDDIVTAVDMILQQTRLPRLVVSVSLDGPQSLHNRIRGVDGCWERAIQTFDSLRRRRSRRFSVYLGHTLQAANLGEFNATLQAANQAVGSVTIDDFHFNLAHSSEHYYANADTDSLPDSSRALAELERIRRQQSPAGLDPVALMERSFQHFLGDYIASGKTPFVCQAGAASCFISPTGTVYPCTAFNAPIGSLRDYGMDFVALWQDPARSLTRENIKKGGCPGCWTPCEAYQTILANIIRHRVRT